MWAYKLKNANKLKAEWWYSGLTWYNLWNWAEPRELRKGQVGLEGGGLLSKNTEEALGSQTQLLLTYGWSLALVVVMPWSSQQSPHFPIHSATVDSSILARMDMCLCLLLTVPVWGWREYPFIPQSVLALDDKPLDNPTYDQGISPMYKSLFPLSGTEMSP